MVCLKKVSLYLNEELWIRFKEAVLKKHGTLRKLSDEVENLLRASMIDEIRKAFKNMGISVKTVFSPEEVKRNRPRLQGPPSEVLIKKMRGRHVEGLPR